MSTTAKEKPEPHHRVGPLSGSGAILGVVLAGGRSSRMGGNAKAFVDLDGRPMIVRVLDRLVPQVDQVIVNANDCFPDYERLGHPVVPDEHGDRLGPIAGVLAGLRHASTLPGTGHIITAPVDLPILPSDVVSRLAHAPRGGTTVAVASSGGRLHPTVALWPAIALKSAAVALEEKQFKMHGLLLQLGYCEVPFAQIRVGGRVFDPFLNVNTPADVEAARTALAAVN